MKKSIFMSLMAIGLGILLAGNMSLAEDRSEHGLRWKPSNGRYFDRNPRWKYYNAKKCDLKQTMLRGIIKKDILIQNEDTIDIMVKDTIMKDVTTNRITVIDTIMENGIINHITADDIITERAITEADTSFRMILTT